MEAMLAELERLLAGYNYVISLRLCRVPYRLGAPTEWYVTQAFGPGAVLCGSGPATPREILADVEYSLRFEGDEGGGPLPTNRRSARFRELLQGVLTELEQAIDGASTLDWFDLPDGARVLSPVWWGFSYIIAGPANVMVFVGAASD